MRVNQPHGTIMTTTGRIHATESQSISHGPGKRFVVYMQGCALRCLYCHSPDCWYWADGYSVTDEQIISQVQFYVSQKFASGVTISGGEPLMQPTFVREILKRCKDLKFHTVLATSGGCHTHVAETVLDFVDLVILDIKSFDPAIYSKVTNASVAPTLQLAEYLHEISKPTWIRFVLIPGLTDQPENITGLANFISPLTNVEKVEVLPFSKSREDKWEKLGYDYQLKQTQPPTPEALEQAIALFKERGVNTELLQL